MMKRTKPWSTNDIPDLQGKIFVVTGGNAGIGFATTRALVAKRARVVIGCRSPEKAAAAVAAIRAETSSAEIEAKPLDLATFASVRAFASGLASLPHIDGLINNAGIMMVPKSKTVDGFETHFGTNVLGHFLLTGLLLEKLAKARSEGTAHTARIVTVSSLGHWRGKIDLDDINGDKRYNPTGNYAQSKLANLVLAYELQRRLVSANLPIISIGVHPGVTFSELGRHAGWANLSMRLYGQSTDSGALPSLMAAVDPAIKGGDYVGPAGFLTLKGPPAVQKSSRVSHDVGLGAQLWQRVEAMTGLSYP